MKRILAAGAAWLGVATAAAAHPGHGLAAQSWLHYLAEPLHVAPIALGALALGLAWRRRARQRSAS